MSRVTIDPIPNLATGSGRLGGRLLPPMDLLALGILMFMCGVAAALALGLYAALAALADAHRQAKEVQDRLFKIVEGEIEARRASVCID